MTTATTSDTSIPPGYPPADWDNDSLGIYGSDQIWRHLYPLLINPHDQKPLLTADAFAAFREHIGWILGILGGAIFYTDDNGPATLRSTLEIADHERARTSPAFAKYLDVLTEARGDIKDTANSLFSTFQSIEDGLYELRRDLIEEAKEAAEEATDTAGTDDDLATGLNNKI